MKISIFTKRAGQRIAKKMKMNLENLKNLKVNF